MSGIDEDFLEDYYDVVVLSTGLKTSILAAALAKSGKSVLHLDRNEFYGEDSASFSFTQLLDWVKDRAHGGTAIGGAAQNRDNQNETSCSATSGTRTAAVGGRNSTASSVCDPETVGLAIARGHARNDLKKEREAEEKERKAADKADGSGDEEEGDGASVKPTGQETGNSDARDESSKETPNSGEGKHPREVDQEKPGGEEQGDPSTTNPTSTEQPEGATATQQKEQQERDRKMKEDEEKKADDELVGKNAALRAKSLDLHFVPLSYHGCRTKAGTPSNTCAQERIQQEAAEEAAAAAGRFGRQPRPSHPAWLSRNNVNKENATGTGGGSAFGEGQEAFLHPSFWGYRTDRALCAADLVRMSRSFNLDLTSQVLLANGPAVDALVASGVSNYLEFKDMQALYLGADLSNGGNIVATDSRVGREGKLGLSRVPCSKADIFSTKLLTPLEKRKLMKFLMFASDWGLQRAGLDVLSRNESGLGRGRSLRRPQNREAASSDFDYDAYADKPFREFLENCGLPERVRAMITHAVALMPGNYGDHSGDVDGEIHVEGSAAAAVGVGGVPTTEAGLEATYRHLAALGRFGETAFIAPLYGVGELPQAFCRMAAVHGAVYVLRRELKSAVIDRTTGRCVGVVDDAGRTFACGALVVGGEYFTPGSGATPTNTASNGHTSSPTDGNSPAAHPAASSRQAPSGNNQETQTESQATEVQPPVPPPAVQPTVMEQAQETNQAPRAAAAGAAALLTRQQQDMARHAQHHINFQMRAKEQAQRNLEYARQQRQKWLNAQQQQQQREQQQRPCGRRRLLRRIVLASGPVVIPTASTNTTPPVPPSADGGTTSRTAGGRGLCVLPPGLRSVGNTMAIHVVSLDASTAACPDAFGDGICVLHLTTTVAAAAAGSTVGVSDDGLSSPSQETISSPRGDSGSGGGDDESDGVLGRAARALLDAAAVHEIWSVGFSWDIQDPVAEEDLPPNMLLCERPNQELYLHEMVVEAEKAFSRLCPGAPFWPSPTTDEDEEDDQAEMLKAVASTVQERSNTEDGEGGVPQDSEVRGEGAEINMDGNQETAHGTGNQDEGDAEDEQESG